MEQFQAGINENIPQIVKEYRTVAVVGLSNKPHRPSHSVASYLKAQGYTIFPVNPYYEKVMGLTCYDSLLEINQPVDVVDIFRRSEDVMPIVEQAIKIGAKVVWMQSGVVNEAAAQKALDAGLEVVMDACLKIEHAMYG